MMRRNAGSCRKWPWAVDQTDRGDIGAHPRQRRRQQQASWLAGMAAAFTAAPLLVLALLSWPGLPVSLSSMLARCSCSPRSGRPRRRPGRGSRCRCTDRLGVFIRRCLGVGVPADDLRHGGADLPARPSTPPVPSCRRVEDELDLPADQKRVDRVGVALELDGRGLADQPDCAPGERLPQRRRVRQRGRPGRRVPACGDCPVSECTRAWYTSAPSGPAARSARPGW